MSQPSELKLAVRTIGSLQKECYKKTRDAMFESDRCYYDGYARGLGHALRLVAEAAIE